MAGNGSGDGGVVASPNVARALPGSAFVRNAGRAWDGVEAMRFRPASEEIAVPPLSNHLVVLHLGPPVDVAQRAGGGRVNRRLVGRGGSAVVPAGLASEWRWRERGEGRADSLHLYLAPALIREAAEGAGLDPDRQLAHHAGQPENVAAMVLAAMTNPHVTGAVIDVDGGERLGTWSGR